MKNNTEKTNKNVELSYRMAQRRLHRGLKMTSIVMVLSMVTVLFPIVPLGHASDICLQVPSEQTMPSIEERSSSVVVLTYNAEAEAKETVDPLEANTFMISEHDDRDGISVEMLDPSAFESRNDVVYALKNMVVHSSPSSDSSTVGKLLYAEQAVRDGQGSSWSLTQVPVDEVAISQQYIVYGESHGWAYRFCDATELANITRDQVTVSVLNAQGIPVDSSITKLQEKTVDDPKKFVADPGHYCMDPATGILHLVNQ